MAVVFIVVANSTRFGKYVEYLQNDYPRGINNYPQILNNAYKILSNWTSNQKSYQHLLGSRGDRVVFIVDGMSVTEEDVTIMVPDEKSTGKGKYMASKKCFYCNEMGHISRNCPKKNKQQTETDGGNDDATTDTTETRTTDRPPDRQTGTVSIMAAVEIGKFNGGGLGWSFLLTTTTGLTTNVKDTDWKLHTHQNMAMSQTE